MEYLKKSSVCLLLFIFFISAGCSSKQADNPTISINKDSDYENTFSDLNLGVIFDFNFRLPHADDRWVNLWVDRYKDGEKDAKPVVQLSYGNSPKELMEGPLGLGMINPNTEETSVFLYGPGVKSAPKLIEKEPQTDRISSWDYGIGEEEIELKLGETKRLAIYRETEGNSLRTVDLQDEDAVNRLIEKGDTVYLLKIMVDESGPESGPVPQ